MQHGKMLRPLHLGRRCVSDTNASGGYAGVTWFAMEFRRRLGADGRNRIRQSRPSREWKSTSFEKDYFEYLKKNSAKEAIPTRIGPRRYRLNRRGLAALITDCIRLHCVLHSACPLEPRAALAQWDGEMSPSEHAATVWRTERGRRRSHTGGSCSRPDARHRLSYGKAHREPLLRRPAATRPSVQSSGVVARGGIHLAYFRSGGMDVTPP